MENNTKSPQENNSQHIDPLIAYWDNKTAADKAKSLIEQPDHEMVPVSNPDRGAESKAFENQQDYQKMRPFYDNDVDAMRAIKEAKNQADYAEMMGKDPATFVGVQTPGTTQNLVGDSRNSVLTKYEDHRIKFAEQDAIESADKASIDFINNLPEGVPPMTAEERRNFASRPLFSEPPYDQDAEEQKSNAA